MMRIISLSQRLTARLRHFVRETAGSYSIETAMIVPMLLWGVLATYTYVDSYRMQALNLRATYTVSDLLTRQWNPVDPDFMRGLGRFHKFLTNDTQPTAMRVTVVYWDEKTETHKLVWSYTTDTAKPEITQSDLVTMGPTIPTLADSDTAIIVETWMNYNPPFAIGLPSTQFANRVVSSPRFVPQLTWSDTPVS